MAIMPCQCAHAFQDAEYGPGNRVFNETPNKGFRCTVCGTLKGDAGEKKKKAQPQPKR